MTARPLWEAFVVESGELRPLTRVEAESEEQAQNLTLRKIAADPALRGRVNAWKSSGRITRRIQLKPPASGQQTSLALLLDMALYRRVQETAHREGITVDALCRWGLRELMDGLDREREEARSGLPSSEIALPGREIDDLGSLKNLSARIMPDDDEMRM